MSMPVLGRWFFYLKTEKVIRLKQCPLYGFRFRNKAYGKQTRSNVSVPLNKVSALEHDRSIHVGFTVLCPIIICKYLSLSHKPDYELSELNTYQSVSLFQ